MKKNSAFLPHALVSAIKNTKLHRSFGFYTASFLINKELSPR